MKLAARLRSFFAGAFRRRRMESEMDEELRFHRERYASDLIRSGLPPEEAKLRAWREFGAIEPLKEECRQARGLRLLDEAAQDLRYAARTFRRQPGFTAAAILTLAIGIGANTAIFTIVDRFILRPLPYPNPERLAVVYSLQLKTGETHALSSADLLDWRRDPSIFETICGWDRASFTLAGGEGAESVWGIVANAEFLPMLGVRPVLGRRLDAADEFSGAPRVAVIGGGLWRRRFGANPDIVGKKAVINGSPVTIVGVISGDFRFPLAGDADIWMTPVWTAREFSDRRDQRWNAVGRIRSGVSFREARELLRARAAALALAYPETTRERGIELRTLRDEIGKNAGSEEAWSMFGLSGCVLLIACFNVSNLQLGRALTRQKEIAVRLGIGAGRARTVRQLITENVTLFLGGAIVSVAVASVFTRWLDNAIPPFVRQYLPNNGGLGIDVRAFLYTLAIGAGTGLVFGLTPALHCGRFDLDRRLREGAARAAGGRVRSALIVTEIALATLVLISAGLFAKGLLRMHGEALGFEPHGVTTGYVLTGGNAAGSSRAPFFEDVVARLEATPGIEAAAAATQVPFYDQGDSFRYRIANATTEKKSRVASFSVITAGYFRALRIPLLRGRTFHDEDRTDGPLAAVINQFMAEREWPGVSPLGKRFAIGPDFKREFTVVGVAGNTTGDVRDLPRAQVYAFHRQFPWPVTNLIARSASPDRNVAPEIRRAVSAADPLQAVSLAMTMEQAMYVQRAPYIIVMQMTACFAAIAILLAATGVYGVTAYAANARRHEFGIRMALGADRIHVITLVLSRGLKPAVGGLVLGIAAAAMITRFLGSLLYHVQPGDKITFVSTALFLAVVAVFACFVPARRAALSDPARVLRSE